MEVSDTSQKIGFDTGRCAGLGQCNTQCHSAISQRSSCHLSVKSPPYFIQLPFISLVEYLSLGPFLGNGGWYKILSSD
jgi:hypothetical protein